jgi:hypothetical protein
MDPGATFDGIESVLVDPVRPSDVYITTDQRGVFKSTDYGLTFVKASVGEGSAKVQTGRSVYSAIDPNTCRDPNTPATLYITQMFGLGGIWKSTDGGVDWTSVWNANIYAPDGVTSIATDVGGDVATVQIVGTDRNHVLVTLHSYAGSGNNNGVFESTDGGGKWIVKKSATFQFQPHADILFPFDAQVWMVGPAIGSSSSMMHRTTDAGVTWSDAGKAPALSLGRCFTRAGSTFYSGSESGVWRSGDKGITWTHLANSGGQIGWVVVTATQIYASDGHFIGPTIRHAKIASDSSWTSDPPPAGMSDNSWDAKVTFDGTHYIIIASQGNAGVWRYVEP